MINAEPPRQEKSIALVLREILHQGEKQKQNAVLRYQ